MPERGPELPPGSSGPRRALIVLWLRHDEHVRRISLSTAQLPTVSHAANHAANPGAPRLTREDYARAERLLPWNVNRRIFGLEVVPTWPDDGDTFWFSTTTAQGTAYVRVDPERGATEPLFDGARLAAALSRAAGIPYDARTLQLEDLKVVDGGSQIEFTVSETRWTYDAEKNECRSAEACELPEPGVVRSPDERYEVFIRDYNLWVRTVADGAERQLTTDGAAGYAYGEPVESPLVPAGLAEPAPPVAFWSPDSRYVLSCRIDQRNAKTFTLVQSVPKDGSVRFKAHTYPYPLPGDEEVPQVEIWSFDIAAGTGTKTEVAPLPLLHYGSGLSESTTWWTQDGSAAFVLTRDRGFKGYRLWKIEPATGAASVVIAETAERGIDPYLLWGNVNIRVLSDGREAIWFSQRDGWGHIYLYDLESGQPVRQLTSGESNVADINHVDEAGRWVYFTAMGREPRRDPYYMFIYRVSLDGGEPELLTPENAHHTAKFAPSGRFFIDTYSRVDLPPVTILRSASGQEVAELARADVEWLRATGWTETERFTAKARDGATDIYGVIVRPTDFDPNRTYPVIDYIYAGPQTNVAPTTFAGALPFGSDPRAIQGNAYWHAQAIAELGFVVVMVDGLGMPGRSKAYHDVTYLNLGDGGIADHVTAIQQLGDRYPYLDLSRVGIYGHSAGGYASAHAILAFPEFYKVCVSSAGNHDHRLDKASWVERYMGFPVEDHYREQANQTLAHRLQGKLLLMHGEMDENVHPGSTMVLVDALIKANKDFDLLIVPNRPHSLQTDPYVTRRRWDYFVRHLAGAEPPAGYGIADPAGGP